MKHVFTFIDVRCCGHLPGHTHTVHVCGEGFAGCALAKVKEYGTGTINICSMYHLILEQVMQTYKVNKVESILILFILFEH